MLSVTYKSLMLSGIMLNVVMLSVIYKPLMFSGILLNVFMLSVISDNMMIKFLPQSNITDAYS